MRVAFVVNDLQLSDVDGQLRLVYESPGKDVLDSPDNLTVTPHGGLLLCEDDTAWIDGEAKPPSFVQRRR